MSAAAVANVVGIASGIVEIGNNFYGLISPDYTKFLAQIVNLLGQLVQQRKTIINLLTYISAVIYASVSNNPIYPQTQLIPSSVGNYVRLSAMGFPEPMTTDYFASNRMMELSDSLDELYHNVMLNNFDLTPSLLQSYKKLLEEKTTLTPEMIKSEIMMYSMQLINWQMQGHAVLTAWGNRATVVAARNPSIWIQTMLNRTVDQVAAVNNFLGSYYYKKLTVGFDSINFNANNLLAAENGFLYAFNSKLAQITFTRMEVTGWNSPSPIINGATTPSAFTVFNSLNANSNFHRNIRCNNVNYFLGAGSSGTTQGIWIQTHTRTGFTGAAHFFAFDTLFPFFQPTDDFFAATLGATCASGQLFISGFSKPDANNGGRILNVYKIDLAATTKHKLVGKFYEFDSTFNHIMFVSTFKLFTVNNRVAFFFRNCCFGSLVFVNPNQETMVATARTTAIRYATFAYEDPLMSIHPVVSNDKMYLVARNSSGIYTIGFGGWNNYVAKDTPSIQDLPPLDTNYFDSFKVYTLNNAAYMAGFRGNVFHTCVMHEYGWVCTPEKNNNLITPASVWGVMPYRHSANDKGDIPIFYSVDGTKFNAVLGNPTTILTAVGQDNSQVLYGQTPAAAV